MRVVVASERAVVRHAVGLLFEGVDGWYVDDLAAAHGRADRRRIRAADVLVLDLDGMADCPRAIRRLVMATRTPVVALKTGATGPHVRAVLAAGAAACIPLEHAADRLVQAVRDTTGTPA